MAQLIVKVTITTDAMHGQNLQVGFDLLGEKAAQVVKLILEGGISSGSLAYITAILVIANNDPDNQKETAESLIQKILGDSEEATAGGLAVEAPTSPPDLDLAANMLTADLGLEVRIQNRLVMAGYNTVQHILDAREEDILAIPGFDNSDFVVLKLALLGKNLIDPNSRLEQSSRAGVLLDRVFKEDQPPKDEGLDPDTTTIVEGTGIKIKALGVGSFIENLLEKAGYTHVNQLLALTEDQIREIWGIGRFRLRDLEVALLNRGLLGQDSPLGRSYHARPFN